MKNFGQMLKQAQELQSRMAEMQAKLEAHEVMGLSGGGMVQVTLNGRGDMRRIKLDPSLIDPGEIEVLEDLIVAAHQDAKNKVVTYLAEESAKLTGGLNLPPGMKLPFG